MNVGSNPARDVDLPHRPTVEDLEDDEAKAMSRDELAEMLALVPEQWHLFFWFLARNGRPYQRGHCAPMAAP
jgi:hypothetical protein